MTTSLARSNANSSAPKKRIQRQRASGNVARRQTLPEYLDADQVTALMVHAPNAQARLVMLVQWRSGLRISEALELEVHDLDFNALTIRVRLGKGRKPRMVPMHLELAATMRNYLDFSNIRRGPIFSTHRASCWRWTQAAAAKATELNQLPPGKQIGTHTLRHSFARHVLANGVPLNVLSRWLGHASIQTTLIYLEILPDPVGYMDRVP